MTGVYQPDYEGRLTATLDRDKEEHSEKNGNIFTTGSPIGGYCMYLILSRISGWNPGLYDYGQDRPFLGRKVMNICASWNTKIAILRG